MIGWSCTTWFLCLCVSGMFFLNFGSMKLLGQQTSKLVGYTLRLFTIECNSHLITPPKCARMSLPSSSTANSLNFKLLATYLLVI